MWNIAPDAKGLPEHVAPVKNPTAGGTQGMNDFRKYGYGGPCPPSGTHRYFFKVYALDVKLDLPAGATPIDFAYQIHTEIGHRDIDRLISDMYKLVLPPGDKILHVIPQEYTVDNEQGITDPIGMSGVRLGCRVHIVTASQQSVENVVRAVRRAGLKLSTKAGIVGVEAELDLLDDEARRRSTMTVATVRRRTTSGLDSPWRM